MTPIIKDKTIRIVKITKAIKYIIIKLLIITNWEVIRHQ